MEEAEATVRVRDPFIGDYPGPGISRDLAETLAGTDVVTIFTVHHHYAPLDPARVKELSGGEHPVIIDGRNIVDPDVFIYKSIGRGATGTAIRSDGTRERCCRCVTAGRSLFSSRSPGKQSYRLLPGVPAIPTGIPVCTVYLP